MASQFRFSAALTALGFGLVFSMGFALPALAADPLAYSVELDGVPNSAITDVMHQTSQLETLRAAGPIPPFALVTRAQDDIQRLRVVLDSFGYYKNSILLTINGLKPDDPDLPMLLDDLPQGASAPVKIGITMGPLYHLGRITLLGPVAPRYQSTLGIRSGDPVIAAQVLQGQALLQAALQEDGHALATVNEPEALADDDTKTVDVTYAVAPGPAVNLGAIRFRGLGQVNEDFVRRAMPLHSGDPYRPSRIDTARRTLAGLGVFSGVNVRADETLDGDGNLPLTFDMQERKRHAVSFAGNYSTDLGVTLSATWSHRNLFGNAEQLNLSVAGTGLGSGSNGLGYNLKAQYVQPLFLEPEQVLDASISGIKQQLDAYDQTAQTLAVLVRRKFSGLWSGAAGVSLAHDLIAQQGVSQLYELVALPISAAYDSTGLADALGDPVTGLRASLALTPTQSFGDSNASFVVAQASASTYFDFSSDGSSVLALRALAGTILGSTNLGLPPDQRLYAGGSATVRGYAYQSLGPQFPDGSPVGAKSVDAATVELRQRVLQDWGIAAFVDAGQAGTGTPFTGKVYAGAGAGLRYYTAIGAVRVDVATPLVQLPGASDFQLYIGLGQAF